MFLCVQMPEEVMSLHKWVLGSEPWSFVRAVIFLTIEPSLQS